MEIVNGIPQPYLMDNRNSERFTHTHDFSVEADNGSLHCADRGCGAWTPAPTNSPEAFRPVSRGWS